MSKTLRYCLLITLTTVLSLQAGTFTNAFNAGLPAGTTLYPGAVILSTNGVDGGCLQLTTNVNSVSGAFVLSDLDSGAKIGSFIMNFEVAMGGGTTPPADGFSVSFGSDVTLGVPAAGEDGSGSGLRVEFDTYLNAAPDDIGIDIWWTNGIIAQVPMDISTLNQYPTYVPVNIELTSSGTLNVSYAGTAIYTDLPIPGFAPLQGRFAFAGRCGGANEICRVDNLGIDTGPAPMPQFLTAAPTGTGVRPNPLITVTMWDGTSAQVNPATITMTLTNVTATATNVTSVTPTITKNGLITTVQYAAPALPSGSTNNVGVSFADNSGSPTTLTTNFSFVVAPYPALPANYAASVDTTKPGFTQRVFQGGTPTVASIAAAETLLAGQLLNPANSQPFPNTAATNTDGTWTFVQPGVLNYNITAPANGGDFTGDVQFPGMPGTNSSTVNFAMEALTYLYLTPGTYTFGVNSDDGFRVSSLATQLGLFDAGRGAADTLFSFAVTETRYYPFRLVYFQGTSAASLEWFSVTRAGQKILINDTSTPGFIPAYSKATSSLPYFLGYSPTGTGNRPDKPILVQMQDGAGLKVNTNAIHLTINGTAVTPSITQTSGVTTVQYNPIWASGISNYVVVSFADNGGVPVPQTNAYSFTVLAYTNIPASYALTAAAVDTTKPGFIHNVFQTSATVPSTINNAEIMLAGQLADAFGNLYPNQAATNADGSHTFVQTNVINYNIAAPASAGDFTNDTKFPGIPGASGNTNTFALETITYLYLPVGYYVLGVNSDDGFRLTTAPNPHEIFPYQLALYDGTRSAADTTGGFGITQAGYYPFRLVYFQATATASLELFSTALSGQKILVNDSTTAGYLQAYRSATDPQPYVQAAYPYRTGSYYLSANNPIGFTLVNGTPAINIGTIQLSVNGTTVTPTITQSGTNIFVSYVPSSYQQTTNSTVTLQLTYTDASDRNTTDAFSFTLHGYESLIPLWTLPPGSRPYLTSDPSLGAQECGLAYNPVTGHLLVGSLFNSTTVRGVYILDPATGNDLGQLKLTNASGQVVLTNATLYNPAYTVGVADDGAIYAADVKQLPYAFFDFTIYRWANETAFPTVAFSDTVNSCPVRLGDNLRVRGAGANTQIIAGAGSSYAQAVLFTTANGTTFTAAVLPAISGLYGDFWSGIAYGSNNTFYTEGPGTPLRQISYNPATTNESLIASYNLAAPAGVLGPLGADLVNGRLIALAVSTTAGAAHSVNVFDLNSLSTTTTFTNNPVDTSYVPTTYANPDRAGSVTFTPDGSMVFVLDTENGIMTYEMNVKSTTSSLSAATTHITAGPGSNYTVNYSGGQAVNYVLLKSTTANALMSTWTPVATNSGTTGSGSFIVAPSGARTFYRVSSRSY